MIGIIRARMDAAPDAPVWSDAQWQQLMNPSVPFSLANYWQACSFGLADTSYRLFPPVTFTDPQPTMTPEQVKADPQYRTTRTTAIVQAVDDRFHPDWGAFNTLLLCEASRRVRGLGLLSQPAAARARRS